MISLDWRITDTNSLTRLGKRVIISINLKQTPFSFILIVFIFCGTIVLLFLSLILTPWLNHEVTVLGFKYMYPHCWYIITTIKTKFIFICNTFGKTLKQSVATVTFPSLLKIVQISSIHKSGLHNDIKIHNWYLNSQYSWNILNFKEEISNLLSCE